MCAPMATAKDDAPALALCRFLAGRVVIGWGDGFPLLTTKKLHIKSIIHELLWIMRGDTNIGYLNENGVRIWDEWADDSGDLGPRLWASWRKWDAPDGRKIDQLAGVCEMIRTNPDSRAMLVSAWNPADIERMALPPCHSLFQFYVAERAVVVSALSTERRYFFGCAV